MKNENFFKEKLKKLKNIKFNFIEMILILILSLSLGIVFGRTLLSNTNYKNIEYSNEINRVYNVLLNEYYEKINENELQNAAIEGMMSLLKDEHSVYLNEEEQEELNQYLYGSYQGAGIQITKIKDAIVITAVFENSPAEKAGLLVGDVITKVNDTKMEGKEIQDVVNLIKNKSEKIKITVKREGKEKTINVDTQTVAIPSVYKKVYETDTNRIGYLKMTIFAENTDEQFEKKLEELEKEKIDSLIIDIRDNPGGHLDSVTNILDLFLGKDDVLYALKKDGKVTKVYGNEKRNGNYNIVVLINEESASASEILASALQEQYNATLIGKTTYGKGTVQQAMNLSTGAMIKYTTQEWLTSLGKTIDKKGITPNIELDLSNEYYKTYNDKEDNQLQEAIKILKDN